ncbi:hypothetical protein D030_1445A, partial [Vibrio parahaemolyticus AQ3810]
MKTLRRQVVSLRKSQYQAR